jgi:DNA helicase-2/ATP-dependent DNA helicase PcrA
MTLDLNALNDAQRRAVEQTDGPLLVLAGAGSGKTRTLTYRIANIFARGRASPHSILAVTFTRKAAWEMRRRLAELVGNAAEDVTATTFHAFAFKLLSAEGASLGFNPAKLKVVGGGEARQLLRRAVKDAGLERAPLTFDEIARVMDRAKDNLYAPESFAQVAGDFFEESIAKVYARYQQLLKERNAVDYGDLVRLAVEILRRNADVLTFYQNLFRYVSIDEFQDTSFAQYQLVRFLVWGHKNVCCVGSPVQTIYSWRGADIANILNRFHADFPGAPVIGLTDNYRSTATILDAAQAVVSNLPYRDQDLRAVAAGSGEPVRYAALSDERNEAQFIVAEIARLRAEHDVRYEDIAVLYRTRPQGRVIEQVLMKRDIPYILIGDAKFFERREIRDIVAFLRFCYDPFSDSEALQRIINVPPRGLGPAAVEKLQGDDAEFGFGAIAGLDRRADLPPKVRDAAQAFAELMFNALEPASKQMLLPQFFDYLLERSGYGAWLEQDANAQQRLASVRMLRTLIERYDGPPYANNPLGLFLADIATMDDDDLPREANGVTLATVHAVKGLEFPVVFVAGLEEEIFPHVKSLKMPAALEEEQRLVYVAMTRAQRELYLTWARARAATYGASETREHAPSRFLARIPRGLMQRHSSRVVA